MNQLKISISILFMMCTACVVAQLSLQISAGIENPYKYKYDLNVTPNGPGPINLEVQDFKFFRTKIISSGLIYSYTPNFLYKRLSIEVGANIGFMNQFVADTIANPANNKLLFNAIHRNIFFTPEVGINLRLYKFISFKVGIEQFIPLRKWIDSDQGSEVFLKEYSEGFYRSSSYYSLGIEFDLDIFKLCVKFQESGTSNHWKTHLLFDKYFVSHKLQRWIINVKYDFGDI